MENAVCFIGHRKIKNSPQLRENLQNILTELINNGAVNFIFGDHSEFNDLCYELVTSLKEKHNHIMRIKFRKDYENADEYTMSILSSGFEDNICPKGVGGAGKAGYAERNQAMIKESDICVFYYDEDYLPQRRKNSRYEINDYQPKSGTAKAYQFAVKNNKQIYNLFTKK
ncbi:MAG: hypothetical protein KBS52_00590 [Clostridiales bacterium]|nr:hypothetical protein [Candidatus Equinaster intestinalis]